MEQTVKEELLSHADEKYKEFTAKLLPGVNDIIGVRLPVLKKLAKNTAKGDWRYYLLKAEDSTFEEIMLQGLVIGELKTDLRETLKYIEQFIPKIDNWSVCDSFCKGLKKHTQKYKHEMWNFIVPYLSSEKEFYSRFGLVMILSHYIDEEYIDKDIAIFQSLVCSSYYSKMGLAWAISESFVKFPEKTMIYLKKNDLDDDTYNKALQKIIESKRVKNDIKKIIRAMKKEMKRR